MTRQMWADLRAEQPSLPADPTITYGARLSNPVQNNTWYKAVLFANLLSLQQGLTRCYYADAGFTTPIDATNYTARELPLRLRRHRLPAVDRGRMGVLLPGGDDDDVLDLEPNFTSGTCGTSSPGLFAALETAAWFVDNSSSLNASSRRGKRQTRGASTTSWQRLGVVLGQVRDTRRGAPPITRAQHRAPTGCIAAAAGATSRYCRSADRLSSSPNNRSHNISFRLARSLP